MFVLFFMFLRLPLSCVAKGRNPEMARKLLNEMKDLGLSPTRFCWNSAISVHARTGNTTGRINRLAMKYYAREKEKDGNPS